jgi:hypothetical protein
MYKTNRDFNPPRLSFAEKLFSENRHAEKVLRFLLRTQDFSTNSELAILRKIHLRLSVDTKSEEVKKMEKQVFSPIFLFSKCGPRASDYICLSDNGLARIYESLPRTKQILFCFICFKWRQAIKIIKKKY